MTPCTVSPAGMPCAAAVVTVTTLDAQASAVIASEERRIADRSAISVSSVVVPAAVFVPPCDTKAPVLWSVMGVDASCWLTLTVIRLFAIRPSA